MTLTFNPEWARVSHTNTKIKFKGSKDKLERNGRTRMDVTDRFTLLINVSVISADCM